MGDLTTRFVMEYRGVDIIQYVGSRSYGIDGSYMYLASVEVAKKVIDTYLKRSKEHEYKI